MMIDGKMLFFFFSLFLESYSLPGDFISAGVRIILRRLFFGVLIRQDFVVSELNVACVAEKVCFCRSK